MHAVGPVQGGERISSLDTVRGFALLGILLMNIVGFGLYGAYDNPTISGGATGLNLWVWIVMHVLAEGKMRCLFSMVFGAGVILLTSRAEQRGAGASTADIYYRRNLWLAAIGIPHAFLLWQGEILYTYGICALVLYPFRHMAPKALIWIGTAMLLVIAGLSIYAGHDTGQLIEKGKAAVAAEKGGAKLTDEQVEAKEKWESFRKHALPTPAEVEKKNQKWRGSVVDVLMIRAESVWRLHSTAYYHYYNLDVFSMMFIGMAFFKLGIFSGTRSFRFYATMAVVGYAIGLSINSYTAYVRVSNNFDVVVNAYSAVTYDIGRLSIALAHVGMLMILVKAGALLWLMRPLAAIGQMALSNYLMHSVVCSTIFCGYGFAMYGRMERYQLYYVVAGIWLFQMIVSPIWLRHFHFGPAEWAWRSLTYWKKQPMRKNAPAAIESAVAV
jgi:uncharacterized protein